MADLTALGALDAFCEHHLAILNSGDYNDFADHCTEDVIYTDPTKPQGIVGREAVRELMKAAHELFEGFRVEEPDPPRRAVSQDGELVMWEWVTYGTMRLPDGGAREIVFPGVDVLRLRDGLIAEYRGYFDFTLVMPPVQGRDALFGS